MVVWGALTAVALFFCFSVTFDSDVKKLDGTEPAVLQAEQRFHEVWGGKSNQAVFVVTARSLEEAMEINDRVYREASALVAKGSLPAWPSSGRR